MPEEDEYAIVSKKEFLTLKRELDRLKKNPLEGSESGENLQSSIDNLNKSLNVMLEVFKQAADDMKLEEHEAEAIGKQIGPLSEKMDMLIDQNQKIAKGIVAIADMVKEKLEEIGEKTEAPKPRLPPLGGGPRPTPPPSYMPPPGAPPITEPEGMEPAGLPPMAPPSPMPPPGIPPEGGEKKSILGGLMK
ncbi:hypothetical protein KY349_01140 [Candidatus Woesearchaeota archaeon]|nr:hypothetical protein [Candidatus Woesearchaeota archaeon]